MDQMLLVLRLHIVKAIDKTNMAKTINEGQNILMEATKCFPMTA